MDPWGTAEETVCQSELAPSITPCCSRFIKQSLYQFRRQPDTLKLRNFCCKITWDTTSDLAKMLWTSEAVVDTSKGRLECATSFCNPARSTQLGMNTEGKNSLK